MSKQVPWAQKTSIEKRLFGFGKYFVAMAMVLIRPVETEKAMLKLLEEQLPDDGRNGLPKDPPPGLLMSMAIRYDHGLACPGYYDLLLGAGEHEKRLDAALTIMSQLYEEVSGYGFYRPELEVEYASVRTARKSWIPGGMPAPQNAKDEPRVA